MYSAMLTRGLASVARDMDSPDLSLIGAHGYCSQELVNLLLTGRREYYPHYTGVELVLGSKVQCLFCFEISTPEGRRGKREGVQISKHITQNL